MSSSGDSIDRSGVLVVDKPVGPTSHDVVARTRRVLGVRRAGHTGTLDPSASGVLVVMLGQATKLGPFLSGTDKTYHATVVLGVATSTLDREGTPVARAPLPDELLDTERARARLDEALDGERRRTEQVPPAYSAVKVRGERAYARTRRGQPPDLEPRPITVRQIHLVGHRVLREAEASTPMRVEVDLELDVGKGYYVRALARDLGQRLGVPAHLAALVRTASGPFRLDCALAPTEPSERLAEAVMPLETAAALVLPVVTMTELGVARASHGRPLGPDAFAVRPPAGQTSAWLDPGGRLVAVGQVDHDGVGRVLRGFPDQAALPLRTR